MSCSVSVTIRACASDMQLPAGATNEAVGRGAGRVEHSACPRTVGWVHTPPAATSCATTSASAARCATAVAATRRSFWHRTALSCCAWAAAIPANAIVQPTSIEPHTKLLSRLSLLLLLPLPLLLPLSLPLPLRLLLLQVLQVLQVLKWLGGRCQCGYPLMHAAAHGALSAAAAGGPLQRHDMLTSAHGLHSGHRLLLDAFNLQLELHQLLAVCR